MNRAVRYGLIAGAAVAALGLALPLFIPATAYKSRIEGIVSDAAGRKFTIAGPLHFTLFPLLGLRAENVALANMPGGRAGAIATAEDVRVGVAFTPLLSGRIAVSTIVLDRPVIALEVDANGHANWTLPRPHKTIGAGEQARLSIRAHFAGLKIQHGRVTYFNARTGSAHAFDNVDATIALAEREQPALVDGAFDHAGQRVSFRAKIETQDLMLQDKPTALDLSITSNLLHAQFKGTVSPDGRGAGWLQIDTPSIRRAGAWLGAHLPDSGGFDAFSLRSNFRGDNRIADFSGLKLMLDGANITGDLKLDATGDVPAVHGALRADRLDLNPYIERPSKPGAPHRPHNSDEWSEKPVTLGVLKKLDADLTLDTADLVVRKMKIGKAHIVLSLGNGRLRANLDPMALYGGSGKAELDIDAEASIPAYHDRLQFDRVALQPFLSDTIGVHQIEGTGTIALDIFSRGDTARTVMGGLNGTGSIDFRDGRLRGVDLGAVARTIQTLLGGAAGPNAFTEYSVMAARFTLANGVLDNRDFHLEGPLMHATGSGKVDVGNRTIDFRIEPMATASLGHQKVSIGVPFRITGSWRHLHYKADVASLVRGVLQNLEAGRAPFKGLFGSSPGTKPASPDKKKHKNLGEALKNMFGIH